MGGRPTSALTWIGYQTKLVCIPGTDHSEVILGRDTSGGMHNALQQASLEPLARAHQPMG